MANPEHVELVRTHGVDFVNSWDAAKEQSCLDLSHGDLSGMDLSQAQFGFTSHYHYAPIQGRNAHHIMQMVPMVHMEGINLSGAFLPSANFSQVNLRDADFRDAKLHFCDFSQAIIDGARFDNATCFHTKWTNVNLASALGLESINHIGPSEIGMQTLVKSMGNIPAKFLNGCGLNKWQIELVRLFNPLLSANSISNMLTVDLFPARTDGPFFIGGAFISYSHRDSSFVEKLEHRLRDVGAPVWRDVHDLVSGPIERQVFDAIRLQDVVILVLSEHSIESDWVEAELEAARTRERIENRDVLCPIALDDSWKSKSNNSVLWRQIRTKNIIDFSSWQTKRFTEQFDRLVQGIKINYSKK